MSEIDKKLADSEKQIAEIERQASDLKSAAQFRPTSIDAADISLMDRLLSAWRTYRTSVSQHPEFRERARDQALKKATGRADEK